MLERAREIDGDAIAARAGDRDLRAIGAEHHTGFASRVLAIQVPAREMALGSTRPQIPPDEPDRREKQRRHPSEPVVLTLDIEARGIGKRARGTLCVVEVETPELEWHFTRVGAAPRAHAYDTGAENDDRHSTDDEIHCHTL
jgi:hypothetical protein